MLFDNLYSAEVSVSGEAGDGEEPSVEALTGELKTANDFSQLAGKHRLTAWLPWRWYASTDWLCISHPLAKNI